MSRMKKWLIVAITIFTIHLFSLFFADSLGLYGLREFGDVTNLPGLILFPSFFAILMYLSERKTDRYWLRGGIIGFSAWAGLVYGYILLQAMFFYDPSPNPHDFNPLPGIIILLSLIVFPILGITRGRRYLGPKMRD